MRFSQVTGPSLLRAPRANHHAGCDGLSPTTEDAAVAFRGIEPLGTRENEVFGAVSPRLARSRTYASPIPSPGTVARLASEWSGSTFSSGILPR